MKKNMIIVLVIVVAAIAFLAYQSSLPGKNDGFARCLVEKGAKMYGAWWCPHCQEQKREFGKSWKIMVDSGAYVECSTTDKQQTEICDKEKIDGYPTWRFADGSEVGGKVSFASLEAKTGCVSD